MLRSAMAIDKLSDMMSSLPDKRDFANDRDVNLANGRTDATSRSLADTRKGQREWRSDYFVGDSQTAVNF